MNMKEPKIRFEGFGGEWKTIPFCDIANRTSTSASTCDFPGVEFEDINAGEGTLNKDVRKKKTAKIGKLFSEGDVLFGKLRPYLKNILLADFSGVAIGDFWVLRPKTITPELLYILTNSQEFMRVANISSGSKMPRADWNLVSSSSFAYPKSKDEQQSLGLYFQHLDSLIQSTTKKIESLKQVKVASLQSMFPQEGETKPRVRFKGFEGDWEKISLGKETYPAGIKNHDNLPLESYSISNEYGFIPQNVQFENGGTMATADKRMYYIVSKNSFGYNPARINVGSLGYYTGDDDVIVSSLYEIFKTSDRICDSFLLYWFKTYTFQKLIEQYQEGGVRFYFFYDKLCMCHTLIPSYEEQQKIASYFTNLDSQITLQTQRLEKLKQIKSACLDNMFV